MGKNERLGACFVRFVNDFVVSIENSDQIKNV